MRSMASAARNRSIATVLALVLAVESVSVVAVAATTARQPRVTAIDAAATTAEPVAPRSTAPAAAIPPGGPDNISASRLTVVVRPLPRDLPDGRDLVSLPDPAAVPAPTPAPTPTPRPKAPAAPAAAPAAPAAPRYVGRNRVWAPSFGINHAVHGFPCSRSKRPGNVVYRWGCAGANNVYLFGHAANVFSGLHRAYLRKTIKVGQKAWYADNNGTVRVYVVTWWKLVPPDTNPDGIYSALARPSLTLQTCVGRNNEYRLIVRLEQVKG